MFVISVLFVVIVIVIVKNDHSHRLHILFILNTGGGNTKGGPNNTAVLEKRFPRTN